MPNETRNELLAILSLMKSENKDLKLKMLLERFEYDIKDKQKELERQQAELNQNMELLEYVRKELGVK